MHLNHPIRAVAAAAVASALFAAAPAAATTHHVHKGESIQAAIDAAKPGDTITVQKATYNEFLDIRTNGIKLKGNGATLTKPKLRDEGICIQLGNGKTNGICVHGFVGDSTNGPVPHSITKNVKISGFTLKGFEGEGVLVFGGSKTTVRNTRMASNAGYGAFANSSSGTQFLHDTARNNGDAGFYIGDSPKANALVRNSVSRGNHGPGVFMRDATTGVVEHNVLSGNCVGALVLADAPGPAGKWKIRSNTVRNNNKPCAGNPAEGDPPLSGLGIALGGATDTLIQGNTVTGNTNANPSIASGGIVIQKGSGGSLPTGNTVRKNTAKNNKPFDIDWDGTGSVKFKNNTCGTSRPSGLC